MKNKLLSTVLILASVVALTACGKSAPVDKTTEATETPTVIVNDTEVIDGGTESVGGNPGFEVTNTLGMSYLSAFMDSTGTTASAVADELIAAGLIDTELVAMPVEPGYLNGFDEEIDGFTSGVMFSPMIGSIPFVGYVFETDDPDALTRQLADKANMAWNICTEADEMVYWTKDNLAFFLMCSNEEVTE